MSTLGDIRNVDAMDNVANSFYMFALTVGMVTIDDLVVNDLSVDGNLIVDGTSDLKSAVTMESTAEIKGAATLESTMDVKGAATLESTADIKGAVTMESTAEIKGAAVMDTTLEVKGIFTSDGGILVQNTGGLDVKGDTDLEGQLALPSLDPNSVPFVNASNIVSDVVLNNGQLVVGATSGAPAAANITAGANISVTNAANSITIAVAPTTFSTLNNILSFGGSSTGITGTNSMLYCQIGNVIYFSVQIVLTSKGSSTGQAQIELPVHTQTGYVGNTAIGYANNFTSTGGTFRNYSLQYSGLSSIGVLKEITCPVNTITAADLTDASFQDISNMFFNGFYFTGP